MKAIKNIYVDYTSAGGTVRMALSSDEKHLGDIVIGYSDSVKSLADAEARLIASAAGVIAGQACLAPHIHMKFPMAQESVALTKDIAQLFYDAHAYAQHKPYVDVSVYAEIAKGGINLTAPHNSKKCLLLWSGGKDSVAALLILRANGYEVTGVHAPVNFPVAEQEFAAAKSLAAYYKLPLQLMTVEWDIIQSLTRQYSNSFDIFPVKNSVPHGRDYFLACALAPLAKHIGAQFVCAGFDRGTWLDETTFEGRKIVFDSQSLVTCTHANSLLEQELSIRFFSPTSGLYEYAIFRHLIEQEPESWKYIASCYWDKWCGKCIKCIKYDAMQRVLGKQLIHFKQKTFAIDNPVFMTLVTAVCEDHATPNMTLCITTLFDRGEFRAMPEVEALLAPHIIKLRQRCPAFLTRFEEVYSVELAPAGYISRFDRQAGI